VLSIYIPNLATQPTPSSAAPNSPPPLSPRDYLFSTRRIEHPPSLERPTRPWKRPRVGGTPLSLSPSPHPLSPHGGPRSGRGLEAPLSLSSTSPSPPWRPWKRPRVRGAGYPPAPSPLHLPPPSSGSVGPRWRITRRHGGGIGVGARSDEEPPDLVMRRPDPVRWSSIRQGEARI
jgi:hypothetical protein